MTADRDAFDAYHQHKAEVCGRDRSRSGEAPAKRRGGGRRRKSSIEVEALVNASTNTGEGPTNKESSAPKESKGNRSKSATPRKRTTKRRKKA